MIKYKFFFDFEKEEKWLGEMARRGYEFVGKNMFSGYCFSPSQSTEAVIRIDYRLFNSSTDFQNYRQLFEDSGWKHIAGTKNSGTQYFVLDAPNADCEIFSDQASKAGRYKRLSQMWLTFAVIYLPVMIALLSSDSINPQAIINPKVLYYTPGLWEKTSVDFWKAFLFETPFALLRGGAWLVFPAITAFYLYFAIRAYRMYKQMVKLK